jgi:hypothetical protein
MSFSRLNGIVAASALLVVLRNIVLVGALDRVHIIYVGLLIRAIMIVFGLLRLAISTVEHVTSVMAQDENSGVAYAQARVSNNWRNPMERTATLAGFFAAHAVWCVLDGETLIPMLAIQRPDGKQEMHRLAAERLEDGVARGHDWLENNPESVPRAVLIYDGFITLPSGKIDALLVEARKYEPQALSFKMAIPYRHAQSPEGFAVHRPKFLELDGDESQVTALAQALFDGIEQHEKGAEVWNAYLDESV